MIKNIELQDRVGCLEDLVLIDAGVILCSVLSKKYLKRVKREERNTSRESNRLIGRLLDPTYKQVMCYTPLVWGEACSISATSKRFSEKKLGDLKTRMEHTRRMSTRSF